MPTISLIVAHDTNRTIGCNGRIPWKLPRDLAYFRRVTLGKPVIMGRKTFDSIGRPLDGRVNIVMSRNTERIRGVTIVASVEDALEAVKGVQEAMVIGGASVYEQFLPLARYVYATHVHGAFAGDVRFPELGRGWRIMNVARFTQDNRNAHACDFVVWERM